MATLLSIAGGYHHDRVSGTNTCGWRLSAQVHDDVTGLFTRLPVLRTCEDE